MRVGILVLNWNDAPTTIACLTSLLDLRHTDRTIYVLDNGSTDDSEALLKSWLGTHGSRDLRRHVASTGDANRVSAGDPVHASDLVYVQIPRNLGYAGGNNVGIRVALNEDCRAVWILNNDTTVAPDTLDWLVRCAEHNANVAAIGSCILEQESPSMVQCLGGARYNWALSTHSLIASGLDVGQTQSPRFPAPDYISGASIFIPASSLEEIGLLDEDFFLYCEEIDFCERGRRLGKPLAVCSEARVWHRFGLSTGASRRLKDKSRRAAFYGTRSAIIVTAKHRAMLLPIVVLVRALYAGSLVARGYFALASAVSRGIASGLVWGAKESVP